MRISPPLLLTSLLSLIACGPGARDGWERYDLRKNPPHGPSSRAVEEIRAALGDGLRKESRKGEGERRVAAETMALQAPAGAELRWTVEVGAEPFLSYVPLARSRPRCRLRYVVGVRRGEELQEVYRHPVRSFSLFAPATVEVSLEGLAGETFELVLTSFAGGDGCSEDVPPAIWGNPAVYSRRPAPKPPGSRKRPNVVLIGIDTLRADALGAYGRTPSVSPAIDLLAAESDVWLEAFSCFNVTNPSFASILTGLYGKNHGVYDLTTPLPEEHVTMAELFQEAGYATAAIVSARHLGKPSGLKQGFQSFQVSRGQFAAELATGEAMDWISEREGPFLLWLHLFDPHTPHTPPRPFSRGLMPATVGLRPVTEWSGYREEGEREWDNRNLGGHRDLYTAEVAYLDRQIGRLMDFLASRGLLATTLVALVADHGENLGEHGILYRHSGLWDATARVPLMIRWPGQRPPGGSEGGDRGRQGRRIEGLVQTLDLFPTVLAAAGLEAPPQDGEDLASSRPRRLVFAEAAHRHGAMVRSAEYLLFQAREHTGIAAGSYLFDVVRDPAEEVNLAGSGLAVEEELAGYLRSWLAERRSGIAAQSLPLSREEMDELRALGYVDN